MTTTYTKNAIYSTNESEEKTLIGSPICKRESVRVNEKMGVLDIFHFLSAFEAEAVKNLKSFGQSKACKGGTNQIQADSVTSLLHTSHRSGRFVSIFSVVCFV